MIFFKTPTAVKHVLQDFKFFHSDEIIHFSSASEILSSRNSLSLMGFFSAGRIQIVKEIYRKTNSVADTELKAIVKITHVNRQNTDPAKQKIEIINFIFG